jgi:hypothetical protein
MVNMTQTVTRLHDMNKCPVCKLGPHHQGCENIDFHNHECAIIDKIEAFFNRFATFTDNYSFPLALWTICTYLWPDFDAFPYVVITSETKRSGKTRTAELLSFVSSNPRMFGAMTAASMFRIIREVKPTIFFDEAEVLSGESAGVMRSVLNMGYRKGQKVPRTEGKQVVEFDVYCPKVFILIGDVMDTLKDRSIIVRMRRAEAKERFVYENVKNEGAALRDEISEMLERRKSEIVEAFYASKGIKFLTDRDEEIWTPIFVLASVICPERMEELSRIAVDMAMEKTQEKRRYTSLADAEDSAQDEEYAIRLLADLHSAIGKDDAVSSKDAVERLRAMVTGPWRKFRGDGITMHNIADMLSRFGVRPQPVRIGKGRKGSNANVTKGYKRQMVADALKRVNAGK